MDSQARQDFLRHRRHSGRSFVIGGAVGALIVATFFLLGGELSPGLTAPHVRIDAVAIVAD